MASSFEALAGFASAADTDTPPPARPWFEALAQGDRFHPDPRFSAASGQPAADPSPNEDDAILQDMLADAEARGRDAALAQMASEGAARAALKLSFQRIDEQLHEQLAQRMAETVAALCEATLAPLTLDRDALQRRCLAAAERIGSGITDATLRLHPDDIALLDPQFAADWTLVPMAELERGTVMFDMAEGAVRDGPGEWRAALQEALGLC